MTRTTHPHKAWTNKGGHVKGGGRTKRLLREGARLQSLRLPMTAAMASVLSYPLMECRQGLCSVTRVHFT